MLGREPNPHGAGREPNLSNGRSLNLPSFTGKIRRGKYVETTELLNDNVEAERSLGPRRSRCEILDFTS